MKYIPTITLSFVVLLASGCGADNENSDGSSKSTYSSCRITSSDAILASDRAKDLQQCWDGVDYEDENQALQWCKQQVSTYMAQEYTFGHGVEYQISSTNC